MATSLNKAMLIGNLTRDPELKKLANGQSVSTFGLATNRTFTDAAGNKKEQADFHNVVTWGKLAELCAQYLSKGKMAYVCGRMQTREWEDQTGVKRFRTEVVADDVIFLTRDNKQVQPVQESEPTINLSDIPF